VHINTLSPDIPLKKRLAMQHTRRLLCVSCTRQVPLCCHCWHVGVYIHRHSGISYWFSDVAELTNGLRRLGKPSSSFKVTSISDSVDKSFSKKMFFRSKLDEIYASW